MDYFLFISPSDSHSYHPPVDLQRRSGVCRTCECVVCVREAENKSVRYEVIAGIISIINLRFSRGAGGEVEKREVMEGAQGMRERARECFYLDS